MSGYLPEEQIEEKSKLEAHLDFMKFRKNGKIKAYEKSNYTPPKNKKKKRRSKKWLKK